MSGVIYLPSLVHIKEFLGKKYVLKSSENFEDYLKFLGKGYFHRKTAMSLRQESCLAANEDGSYTFSFRSPLVSADTKFTSGVEFEETRADGVKVMAIITIEDHIMTHIQTETNGRISKHVREFHPDRMIVTTTGEGFDKTAVRHYICLA